MLQTARALGAESGRKAAALRTHYINLLLILLVLIGCPCLCVQGPLQRLKFCSVGVE